MMNNEFSPQIRPLALKFGGVVPFRAQPGAGRTPWLNGIKSVIPYRCGCRARLDAQLYPPL